MHRITPPRRPHRDTRVDLTVRRSVGGIIAGALFVYGADPLLFVILALAVVAPYELIVLAATGVAPLGQQAARPATALILLLLDFAFVAPLVSALYVRAVSALARGERPALGDVARQGLQVLPVAAAAQIVAGIGIGIGLLVFVIPGVILSLRWAVVAQAAAIERTDWLGALRRSGELTRGAYLHVFGLLALIGIFDYAVVRGAEAIAGTHAGAGAVVLGIAVDAITRSVTAIMMAVLYFELRARRGEPVGAL